MFVGLFKFLFKIVGLDLLWRESMQLVHQEIDGIKERIRREIVKVVLKVVSWLLLVTLLMIGFVFCLLALAFYLNEIFYSSYKGFLLVAGGCGLLFLLALLIVSIRSSK